MDLTVLKNYFDACYKAESELQQYWRKFEKLPSYSIFKLFAPKSQPKLDANLIKNYILGFNWQAILNKENFTSYQLSYKVHSTTSQMSNDQFLDFGLDLLIIYWGTNKCINFDDFSLLIKGEHQLPAKQKQVPFPQKVQIFQCLMTQIKNLIHIEETKKNVYYQYKNLSDLFQTVTSSKIIENENIQRLYLSFGDRKDEKQMQKIYKRARLPWDFNDFLSLFKRSAQAKTNQTKIHYSAKRNKEKDNIDKSAFTTPRRQKYLANQSSTKVTKLLEPVSIYATPTKQIRRTQQSTGQKQQNYILILARLLQLEQQFINDCTQLIKRKDFDLQLVYEHHGKKFQKVLNARYGVCNFSAFVRFIVPRDFEHRYLSFIRYQADNTLSTETQELIDDLLQKYERKQSLIKQVWKNCDKQLLLRYFCHPNEKNMRSERLKQIFTTRQSKILLQRLDPHQKGHIQLEALI